MTASPRTYPRLRVEATDPATPGARLAKLTRHRVAEIAELARANPGLPDEEHLPYLCGGNRAAWANPLATFRALDVVTSEMQNGARNLVYQGNAPSLAATVVRDWWANETDPLVMLEHLANQGTHHQQTPIHRRAIGALCACLRWAADHRALTTRGRLSWVKSGERLPAVEEFETWATGGPRPTQFTMEVEFSRIDVDGQSVVLRPAPGTSFVATTLTSLCDLAVTPRDKLKTAVEPMGRAHFTLCLVRGLCDVLRAAIPDPTEGLG